VFFADTKKLYPDDLMNAVVIAVKSGTLLPTGIIRERLKRTVRIDRREQSDECGHIYAW
jgi:hypothetical protein